MNIIEDLHPVVKFKCRQWIVKCEKAGIEVLIIETFRSKAKQEDYYSRGRDRSGKVIDKSKVITLVKGGYSMHNYGLAFDFVPLVNKKAKFDRIDLYRQCGQIWEKIGGVWGGRWKSLQDYGHCEYSGGLTAKDLLEGKVMSIPKDFWDVNNKFVKIKLDNKIIFEDNLPLIGDKLYLPLRLFAEAMGAHVDYKDGTINIIRKPERI